MGLKSLTLSSNSLSTLDGLRMGAPRGRRVQLERLIVNDNHLISMGALGASAATPSLVHLSLSCNNLTSVCGLAGASRLTSLILSSNRLESLAGVEYCGSLTYLDVSVNNIESLGGSLRCLGSLQHLDCSFNRLAEVGDGELVGCTRLTHLKLNENRLRRLPRLATNVNLRELHASVNRIEALELGPAPAAL